MRTKQGVFKPNNPHKYKGNSTNIIYRSSYELKLFRRLDAHEDVEWWASEEMSVNYVSPLDNRRHRYYPDVLMKKKNDPKVIMIEVKPAYQTVQPTMKKTKKGKPTKSSLYEMREWGRNTAKWAAARKFCEKRNWEFIIMTENELGIRNKRKVKK